MALVRCPECGAKISDSAETCPKCGATEEGMASARVENAVNNCLGCGCLMILAVFFLGGGFPVLLSQLP